MTEEELSIDVSKILSKDKIKLFFKKYGIVFLLLIPIILSIYVRMIPEDLPITDTWAKNSVENYYQNMIKAQIKQQYSALPDSNLETLAQEQYEAYYKENKDTINSQITQLSKQYKALYQDENGYTYMPDIDPYVWLMYARNYLDHGYTADTIINGTYWETHQTAPNGVPGMKYQPQGTFLAWQYKILHSFNSKLTLMQSSTYFPVIFSALAVIPAFFIGMMVAGPAGGFFSGVMLAVNGAFLGRTTWGHADTDAWNIFFPMYFIWFIFLAIKSKTYTKSAIYSALAGITLWLFSIFWSGWWYVFDFAVGMILLYSAYLFFFEHNKSHKSMMETHSTKIFLLSSIVMFVVSGILISFTSSPSTFFSSVVQPIEFSDIKAASHADLWPNVYTTVAELNSATIKEAISSIGGNLFFVISLIGLILLFMKKEGKRENIHYALLMILWFIGIFYASTKGVRFTMMLVPPVAICFGVAIGLGSKKLSNALSKAQISERITKAVIIIIAALLLLSYINSAASSIQSDVPIINDAWWNSLTKIKEESRPNAIINSWWDFGHHFKFIADRAVTFDGGTQNSPMAHWIGKVLLTDNEQQAIGILRMLDCGSNDAFELLNKEINDTSVSVSMIYSIIELNDKSKAESYLKGKNISQNTINEMMPKMFCSPPEDYFITSGDMVGKGAVWAHFGIWDFNRADVWVEDKNLPKDEAISRIMVQLNETKEEATNTYFEIKSITSETDANSWIAPWPGYSDQASCTEQENNTLVCGGIMIDMTAKTAKISTNKGIINPNSISYVENGKFIVKNIDENASYSLLLVKEDSSYEVIILSPQLAGSMFTRLFYYNGTGLSHFNKFDDETQPDGSKILVWKVKW